MKANWLSLFMIKPKLKVNKQLELTESRQKTAGTKRSEDLL